LQEERRLAYVSFTRAKEKLILTFAQEYSNKKVFSSIFLNEIQYKNNPDILFQQDLEQKYHEESIKKIPNFSSALNQGNFPEILGNIVSEQKQTHEKEHRKFSPSALILYSNCQKEFEYKYVYNMPERKTISWDAMRLGSFVHLILEKEGSIATLSVPVHKGKNVKRGTLRDLIKDAELSIEEFLTYL